MNLVILFSRLVILLILFCSICLQMSLASNDNNSTVQCSTQYKPSKQIENFLFECSVVLQTGNVSSLSNLGCSNYDFRSLVIKSFNSLTSKYEVSFICTSNYAITVDVKFADDIVSKKYLNMTWSRKVVDFENEGTYTYNLQIFPPRISQNRYKGDAVKYTFSSVQFPSETIDILWFSYYGSTDRIHNFYCMHWMKEKRDITLTEISKGNAMYIPCHSPFPIRVMKITTYYSNIFNYNSTTFGVFLSPIGSISDLLGEYQCYNPSYTSSFLKFNIVSLNTYYKSNYKVYSTNKNALQSKIAFMTMENLNPYYGGFKQTKLWSIGFNFELQCQAKNPNITYYDHDSRSRDRIQCNSTYYKTFDDIHNQTLTTAVCITTSLENDHSFITYKCLDENSNFSHIWIFKNNPSPYFNFDYDLHEMHCLVYFYNENEFNFIQDSCNNPLTCKLTEKSLQNKKSLNTISYCKLRQYRDPQPCLSMKFARKGIYMCNTDQRINTMNYLSFSFSNIYYVGFDEKVYQGFQSQPPRNAIIKILYLGPSEQIMIKDRPALFSFYCEAHSFFFEEGIQWLFQYSNGTKHLVPSDYISNYVYHTPKKFQEYSNPSSSVNILVPDKTIRNIICAAPRLSILKINNYREWEFKQINISIFDAIAPSFVDTESNFFFIIGENDKEIKCQAFGLPKPKMQWTAMSGQNLLEENIIDLSIYSVLKFPIYYSSDEGDYKCTATNEVGNVSKTFSVCTSVPDSTVSVKQLAFLLTGIIVAIILTFTSVFYWHIRKMKMKQSLEMQSILELLKGKPPNLADESTLNPLKLPYDRKWELEKHSFCIDETKILGCGEFGIVYKGTIAKLNIDVAFKSLKSQGSTAHLKSLVSELKLLLYIDKHSNIVELLGAYTQEIKKGIMYMAIEFCALGSLESHLHSNKGRFQKCPILSSYIEGLQNPGEDNCTLLSETSNYSVKSLLKWCSEISQAMDHLYSKRVVHRDLATRNVLLTADWTAKLTDFGLSRKMYNSDQYVRKGQDPLPWRWLALESLLNKVFSVKTDVWAFGITMWEIFSLGETPYPGLSASMEFVEELENGLRNSKPKYASKELYDVMVACWNCEANERPSFASLGLLFRNSLRHPTFQVNVEEMEAYDPNEMGRIEYIELEEL